jgi:hypothetical protein
MHALRRMRTWIQGKGVADTVRVYVDVQESGCGAEAAGDGSMELAVRADGEDSTELTVQPAEVDRLLIAETALALANKQLAEANRKLAMVSCPHFQLV